MELHVVKIIVILNADADVFRRILAGMSFDFFKHLYFTTEEMAHCQMIQSL